MKLLVVAGEASADKRLASILKEFKFLLRKNELKEKFTFFGVGGGSLISEGLDLVCHLSQTSVMGFTEVIHKIPFFAKLMNDLVDRAVKEKVDAAILVDMPDFNLRLAKKLKQKGIKVIYYISPSVWAWRKKRVEIVKKYVDKMLVIYPFEEEFYKKEGVDVIFVGHPGVDELRPTAIAPKNEKIKIALLPGSRKQEVKKLVPIMRQLIEDVNSSKVNVEFKVLIAKNLELDFVKNILGDFANLEYDTSGEIGKVNDCNFAVVASGTATLEMAIQAVPMIVIYKISKVSGFIYEHIIKYSGFVGMVNIIHGKEVCKELIQSKLNRDDLYQEAMKLIKDESYRLNQRSALLQTRNLLIKSNASEFTAKEILNVIGRKTKTQ